MNSVLFAVMRNAESGHSSQSICSLVANSSDGSGPTIPSTYANVISRRIPGDASRPSG